MACGSGAGSDLQRHVGIEYGLRAFAAVTTGRVWDIQPLAQLMPSGMKMAGVAAAAETVAWPQYAA